MRPSSRQLAAASSKPGNTIGEAEAEAALALLAWLRGDAPSTSAHLDRIDELLPTMPEDESKAVVLSNAGRLRGLRFELDAAVRLDEQALALAQELGLRELTAYTLNNLATVHSYNGDPLGALELGRQAADIARAERSPELLRVLNNLMVVLDQLGRLREHDQTLEEFEQLAHDLGDAAIIRFTRGSAVPWTHFLRGRWDDALAVVEEFIAEAEQGTPHRLVGNCYLLRAQIRVGRGETEAAEDDLDRAATTVEPTDLQTRSQLATTRVRARLEQGSDAELTELADEVLELAGGTAVSVAPPTVYVLHRLGRSAELLALVESTPDSPLRDAARHWLGGDIRAAAAVYAAMEVIPVGEGLARLAAGRELAMQGRRKEADVELRRAIEVFRPMRARRYVQEAEALLSTAAAAREQPG